jgi:hypothetical protein
VGIDSTSREHANSDSFTFTNNESIEADTHICPRTGFPASSD